MKRTLTRLACACAALFYGIAYGANTDPFDFDYEIMGGIAERPALIFNDGAKTYARTKSGEQIVYFEESDQFEVDSEAACAFVTCSFDAGWSVKVQQHSGMESARFWLNEGILRLPGGMAGRYQEMSKRGQYFAHLAERHNLTPVELDRFLVDKAISNAEHLTMLNLAPVDLFSQAA